MCPECKAIHVFYDLQAAISCIVVPVSAVVGVLGVYVVNGLLFCCCCSRVLLAYILLFLPVLPEY